jgi:hypothetical protein
MPGTSKPKFVYVTYISSTPEKVFNALTDPDMTKQYWVRHRNAKTSRVTFNVEPWMNVVRLTVTHDELEPDSPMLQGVSSGWPLILSSLKTLLESGLPLAGTSTRMTEPPK